MDWQEYKARKAAKPETLATVTVFAVVIAFACALGSLAVKGCSGESAKPGGEFSHLYATARESMAVMQSSGIVKKVDAKYHRVYVSPLAWAVADIEQKEELTCRMAIYCADEAGDDMASVTVIDHQSGKELASYSGFWGFAVK